MWPKVHSFMYSFYASKRDVQNKAYRSLIKVEPDSALMQILCRRYQKYVLRSSWKVTDGFLSDFKQTWISSTDFGTKVPRITFYENPSSGSRSGPRAQTDTQTGRHDEANSALREQWEGAPKKTGTFLTSWMVKRTLLHIKL